MKLSVCRSLATSLVVGAALVAGMASTAFAQVDFSGKRITMTVPTAAGGGADLYARFLGPLIAERLPGSPTLIVQNVPGAGAIAGSNQFQDRAKRDGTDLLTASASVMVNFAFGDERAKYKLDEWIPIISSPQGSVVYARSELGVTEASEIPQLYDQTVTIGANNPTGGDMRVLLAMDLLGVELQPVFGMNRAEAFPAFQRGEVTLDFAINNAFEQYAMPMIEAGEAVALFSMGFTNEDGVVGHDPAHPDLPHFLEVYEMIHGEPLSGPALKAWNALFNMNVMATRAILLPDGTPQEVVDTYEKAVRQLLADFASDATLFARAVDVLGEEPQAAGEAAIRNVRSAVVIEDEAMEYIRTWLAERFDAKI